MVTNIMPKVLSIVLNLKCGLSNKWKTSNMFDMFNFFLMILFGDNLNILSKHIY